MRENDIGTRILEAAINVHRALGSELLETAYEVKLVREIMNIGLKPGYLLNFGEDLLKNGVTCCVNGLEE